MALDPDVVVVAPNELITADHLNDIRANLVRLDTVFDTGYSTWTPTLANISRGSGYTEVARYVQHGPVVHALYGLISGSGMSVTGDIRVSLPLAASRVFACWGVFVDAGADYYPATPVLSSTTDVSLRPHGSGGAYATLPTTSATIPFTWASPDQVHFGMTYLVE